MKANDARNGQLLLTTGENKVETILKPATFWKGLF